jgi:FxLD family lantipeptide
MGTDTITAPTVADAITDMEDELDFDLDARIVESGPFVAQLMCSTDDGCGKTCQTACTSCKS